MKKITLFALILSSFIFVEVRAAQVGIARVGQTQQTEQTEQVGKFPGAMAFQATAEGLEFIKDYLFLQSDPGSPDDPYTEIVLPIVTATRSSYPVRLYRKDVGITIAGDKIRLAMRIHSFVLPLKLSFLRSSLTISNLDISVGLQQQGEELRLSEDRALTAVHVGGADLHGLPGAVEKLVGVRKIIGRTVLKQMRKKFSGDLRPRFQFMKEFPVTRATISLGTLQTGDTWVKGGLDLTVANFHPRAGAAGRMTSLNLAGPSGVLAVLGQEAPSYALVMAFDVRLAQVLVETLLQNANLVIGERPLAVDIQDLAGSLGSVGAGFTLGEPGTVTRLLVKGLQFEYADATQGIAAGAVACYVAFQGATLEARREATGELFISVPLDVVARIVLSASRDGRSLVADIGTPYIEDAMITAAILGPEGLTALMKRLADTVRTLLSGGVTGRTAGLPTPVSLPVAPSLGIRRFWREADTVLLGMGKLDKEVSR